MAVPGISHSLFEEEEVPLGLLVCTRPCMHALTVRCTAGEPAHTEPALWAPQHRPGAQPHVAAGRAPARAAQQRAPAHTAVHPTEALSCCSALRVGPPHGALERQAQALPAAAGRRHRRSGRARRQEGPHRQRSPAAGSARPWQQPHCPASCRPGHGQWTGAPSACRLCCRATSAAAGCCSVEWQPDQHSLRRRVCEPTYAGHARRAARMAAHRAASCRPRTMC